MLGLLIAGIVAEMSAEYLYEVHTILQAHAEGSSLRGISRISGRAYGTVVSLVRDASQKAQMIQNQEVQQTGTTVIQKSKINITAMNPIRCSNSSIALGNLITDLLKIKR